MNQDKVLKSIAVAFGTGSFLLLISSLFIVFFRNTATQSSSAVSTELEPHSLFAASLSHDFGKVLKGSRCEHRFVLDSLSTQPVHLKINSVSCSCTDVSLSDKLLLPGQSVMLSATLDGSSGNRSELRSEVLVEAVANGGSGQVASSSPQRVRFKLSAEVDQGHGISPSFLDFGEIQRGTQAAVEYFQIALPLGCSPSNISWEIPEQAADFMELKLEESDSPPGGGSLLEGTLSIDPNLAPQGLKAFSGSVKFQIEDNRSAQLFLSSICRLTPIVKCVPTAVYWRSKDADQKSTVFLDAANEQRIKVEAVECSSPAIGWAIRYNEREESGVSLDVFRKPSVDSSPRSTLKLSITLNGKQADPVEIPVLIL